jgi:hypothetical protein
VILLRDAGQSSAAGKSTWTPWTPRSGVSCRKTLRAKNYPKRAERLYGVQVSKRPNPDWPVVLGDYVHNLRSALDHLTWRVVEQHGTPTDQTQFPVYLTQKKFRAAWPNKVGKVGRKGLKTAFDRLQLYKSRPELYPLWVLHRLDIIDKHKTLLTTTMPLQPVLGISGPLPGPGAYDFGPFDDGTDDILRVRVPFGPDGPVEGMSSRSSR